MKIMQTGLRRTRLIRTTLRNKRIILTNTFRSLKTTERRLSKPMTARTPSNIAGFKSLKASRGRHLEAPPIKLRALLLVHDKQQQYVVLRHMEVLKKFPLSLPMERTSIRRAKTNSAVVTTSSKSYFTSLRQTQTINTQYATKTDLQVQQSLKSLASIMAVIYLFIEFNFSSAIVRLYGTARRNSLCFEIAKYKYMIYLYHFFIS